MTRKLRLVAVVSVLVLAAAACGGGAAPVEERTTGSYGSGVDLDDVGKTKKVKTGTQAQGGTTSSGGTQQSTGSTGSKSSGGGFTPDLSRKIQDGGSAGVNAYFFLNKVVPRFVIEIDAVRGYEPSQDAITLLNQRLTGVADKPGGIQFLPVDNSVKARDTWSMADIQKAEDEHRSTHNSMQQASIYILYVNGEPSSPGPIGIAYSGSSDVIFIEQVRGISTPVVGAEAMEQAVLVHEIGHLLALVNQTYKSPRNHEDPEHRGHSSNKDSVMYWAVETLDVVQVLGQTGPSTSFDKDDLADLADLKSGKLP